MDTRREELEMLAGDYRHKLDMARFDLAEATKSEAFYLSAIAETNASIASLDS